MWNEAKLTTSDYGYMYSSIALYNQQDVVTKINIIAEIKLHAGDVCLACMISVQLFILLSLTQLVVVV